MRLPLPIEEIYRTTIATREEIEAEKEMLRNAARIATYGESACEKAVQGELVARTIKANVPVEFREVALDLRHTAALKAGKWLYIHGNVGTGKSTMASGTLRGWMAHNHGTALWTTEKDMLDDIDSAKARWEPMSDALWRYMGPRVLVIDDMGTVDAKGSAKTLKQVVDSRWANHRPTIITSQLPLDGLCRKLAAADADAARAIGSRLSQCIFVHRDGPDRRMHG